jgi:hypothetical protein
MRAAARADEGNDMPKVKQLSAWVDHRPGALGELADALGEKKINIRAFMATTLDNRGFLRLVVDKAAEAKRILEKHGWATSVDEVIEVTLPDSPGALGAVADRLGEEGVSVDYAYLGTAASAKKVNLYLSVTDQKAALKALRR